MDSQSLKPRTDSKWTFGVDSFGFRQLSFHSDTFNICFCLLLVFLYLWKPTRKNRRKNVQILMRKFLRKNCIFKESQRRKAANKKKILITLPATQEISSQIGLSDGREICVVWESVFPAIQIAKLMTYARRPFQLICESRKNKLRKILSEKCDECGRVGL